MDTLLIVFLTVIITIVSVLLVEAVFLSILVRLGTVQMRRQQCPCCRTKHAERCSSQVATATCNEHTNAARPEDNLAVNNSQESHVHVIDETLSTSHHNLTGSNSLAAATAENNTDGGPTSMSTDDQCTITVRRKPQGHEPTVDCEQPSPNRPCSCWTTVSSDIRFENADDGMVVYHQAKMTVPSSCRCLPKTDDTAPGRSRLLTLWRTFQYVTAGNLTHTVLVPVIRLTDPFLRSISGSTCTDFTDLGLEPD